MPEPGFPGSQGLGLPAPPLGGGAIVGHAPGHSRLAFLQPWRLLPASSWAGGRPAHLAAPHGEAAQTRWPGAGLGPHARLESPGCGGGGGGAFLPVWLLPGRTRAGMLPSPTSASHDLAWNGRTASGGSGLGREQQVSASGLHLETSGKSCSFGVGGRRDGSSLGSVRISLAPIWIAPGILQPSLPSGPDLDSIVGAGGTSFCLRIVT